MESNNVNYNEECIKGGLIVGAVSIILTMLVYLFNIELMVKWWFGVLNLVISMGLLIFLGISFRNLMGGFISYKNAIIKGKWRRSIVKKNNNYGMNNKDLSRPIMTLKEEYEYSFQKLKSVLFNKLPNSLRVYLRG